MYAITREGRAALRAWLGASPAAPALELEAMIKVFFADAGTLAQLRSTLDAVDAQASERIAVLRSMIDASREGPYEFAKRLPVNALALRFQLDHEEVQVRWARWGPRADRHVAVAHRCRRLGLAGRARPTRAS